MAKTSISRAINRGGKHIFNDCDYVLLYVEKQSIKKRAPLQVMGNLTASKMVWCGLTCMEAVESIWLWYRQSLDINPVKHPQYWWVCEWCVQPLSSKQNLRLREYLSEEVYSSLQRLLHHSNFNKWQKSYLSKSELHLILLNTYIMVEATFRKSLIPPCSKFSSPVYALVCFQELGLFFFISNHSLSMWLKCESLWKTLS